ncbi:MAG: thioredoxin domain-containing protein [Saprospiraceae bacterium]|nr:thioredoxin domain-containing protein [Saprospiraceae bacterium]
MDDYPSVILAYIKLYEITFDEIWLDKANKLCQIAITDYSDESNVYFYYNSKNDDKLIVRKSEMEDNVIPSSNSMMADVLLQLGHYYYNQDYIERSKQMCASAIDNLATHAPTFYTNWLKVNLKHLSSPYEIAIVGDDSTEKNLAMQSHYLPQCIFLGGKTEGTLELLKDKLQSGQTMIYVCKNKVCKLPVNEINEALKLIH